MVWRERFRAEKKGHPTDGEPRTYEDIPCYSLFCWMMLNDAKYEKQKDSSDEKLLTWDSAIYLNHIKSLIDDWKVSIHRGETFIFPQLYVYICIYIIFVQYQARFAELSLWACRAQDMNVKVKVTGGSGPIPLWKPGGFESWITTALFYQTSNPVDNWD